MESEIKHIVDKLNHMQTDIDFIKKRIVDLDNVLTEDDINSLDQAEKDLKSNKVERL